MVKSKIVICGSMRFLDQMRSWQKKLESLGHEVYTPTLIDFHKVRDEEGDLVKFEEIKRKESKRHFQKIKSADILLILNYHKDGKENYIGGNTFAEIAYAVALNYCHKKNIKIYTINPIPQNSPYTEELSAWQIGQWQKDFPH